MDKSVPMQGLSNPIRDAAMKVCGQTQYVGDMKFPGMLYGRVLFSPVPHAKIKSIDTSAAEALPGVRAVACYKNSPDVKYNSATRFYEHQIPNTERIFDDTVRFVGDRVAAVAADTEEIAKAALKLIQVEYEALPFYTDVEEAMQDDALPIHGESNIVSTILQKAGDIDDGFAEADEIFEDRYSTPPIHHGAIEPHISIAHYDAMGKLTVTAPCQNTFGFRIILCRIFGLPMSRVRVVSPVIGGAFGGKLEVTTEAVSAQLSMMTGKPVQVEYTRKECFDSTRTRHGSVVYIKTGVKKDGTITAQDIHVITNTGAYAGSALNVMGALSHKVFKIYKCKNLRFTGHPVYTNTPIAGAMRGYGSPQAFFGQQRQFAKIAKTLGMELSDFQLKNLVEPDALDPAGGYPLGNPHPLDCVKKGKELMKNWPELSYDEEKYTVGVGMAMGAHGNGCFGAHRDQTCMSIKMNEDGSCVYYTGSHDMGHGSVTVQAMIVANVLKLPLEHITAIAADSDTVPWNLGDYASRGVYVMGSAAKKCAEAVAKELIKEAALLLETGEDNLELNYDGVYNRATKETTPLDEVMIHAQNVSRREIICNETFPMAAGPSSYGAHFARVLVNNETGDVEVTDYVAVHDVGHVLNRMGIEGQLEGAVHMGIGYALSEGLAFDDSGKNIYNNLRKNKMLTAKQMPRLQVDFIEEYEPTGPYGAKSIGEVAVVPSAPAVINAVCNALDVEINDLPYRHLAAAKK